MALFSNSLFIEYRFDSTLSLSISNLPTTPLPAKCLHCVKPLFVQHKS